MTIDEWLKIIRLSPCHKYLSDEQQYKLAKYLDKQDRARSSLLITYGTRLPRLNQRGIK